MQTHTHTHIVCHFFKLKVYASRCLDVVGYGQCACMIADLVNSGQNKYHTPHNLDPMYSAWDILLPSPRHISRTASSAVDLAPPHNASNLETGSAGYMKLGTKAKCTTNELRNKIKLILRNGHCQNHSYALDLKTQPQQIRTSDL